MTAERALQHAIEAARGSKCAKSQRGVVIFHPDHDVYVTASNGPPAPFTCDGSPACRAGCRDVAIHAEARAILRAQRPGPTRVHLEFNDFELLHVKVVDNQPVPSGPPSCVRCSALILEVGIAHVWLLHEDGLKSYGAEEFHAESLRHHDLPACRRAP